MEGLEMDIFAIGDEARIVLEETGKTPRQLAEENEKLREEVEDLKREVDSLYHSQREGL